MAQLQSTGITGSISIKTTDGFKNKLIGECNSIYAAGAGPQCHIAIGECVYPDASFGICGQLTITNGGSGYGTPSTATRPCAEITSTDGGTAAYAYVSSFNDSISYIYMCTPGYRYSGDPACTTVTITGGNGSGATAEVSAFVTASKNIGIGYNIGEHAGGYMCNNIAIGECILNITGSSGCEGSALTYTCCNIYLGNDIAIGCNNCYSYGCEKCNVYIGNCIACRIGCTADLWISCDNVALGTTAMYKASCGLRNVAIGYQALPGLSSNTYSGRVGNCNVVIGTCAGRNFYNSYGNIAIGLNAMRGNSSLNGVNYNIGLGYHSLCSICTGDCNVGIGFYALRLTTSGGNNVGIGRCAGYCNTTGYSGIFIGDNAGRFINGGDQNIIVGGTAASGLTNNSCRNQIFGYAAAYCLGNNSYCNTFIGHGTAYHLRCDTQRNVYVGSLAGWASTAIDSNQNNTIIGYQAGRNVAGSGNIIIGYDLCCSACTAISNCFHLGCGAGNCLLVGCLSSAGRTLGICGTLSKTAGSFQIPHPDPAKTQTHDLFHSFVESPTAGDNLYRFEVEVENGQATIDLPDYYKHLNENDQVWVNPKDHFGRGYGVVNQDQTTLTIFADTDGAYNILLIGTRKDETVQNYWKGTERLKQEN